jgi:hypothetical protein
MANRSSNLTSGLSRVWFPIALVALVVLGIPGLVLFALNLLDRETSVNKWLQEHYRLTYHLAIPWWAALLLLLVPFAIVLLYFLKLKRKPLQVPSTFLWRKSIEDLHVNALFQWLRDNVLLLLQLLTLLALIYSVMAFQFHGTNTEGVHYILMLDNSASMSATDVAPNRLEQAKQQALREIDAHTDNDFGMVILFNSSAEILQSYTSDRNKLREAVSRIEPTQRPTRIEEALSLAASLANPHRSTDDQASRPVGEDPEKARTYVSAEGIPTEVHLFSDGRFPDVPDFAQGNLDMRMHLIGQLGPEAVDNIGIITLNALRDEKDPTKLQVLVNVRNFRNKATQVKVRLSVRINGELQGDYFEKIVQPQGVDVPDPQQAMIPARSMQPGNEKDKLVDKPGEGFVAFELADVDDRSNVVLHAQLANVNDRFPLDNDAWLILGVVRKARVLIAGTPNKILRAFFDHESTRKVATVTYIDKEDLKSEEKFLRPSRSGEYDLVIFDRCTPSKEEEMPLANTFFIDALPPPWKKEEMPKVENPHIKGWMSKDAILRGLTALYDVGISESFQFNMKDPRVPPRSPRLIESDRDTALLFSLSRQSFSDVVLAFAILNDDGDWVSNWPLQPSFPLFMRNVIYALGNISDAAGEENVQPGQVKTLRPDVAVTEVEVLDPNPDGEPRPEGPGKKLQRGSRADFVFGDTDRVGVYQVKWNGQVQRSFAVNLLDADESNIEPRPVEEIKIGSAPLSVGEPRRQPRDTWKWIALIALGLLLLEWYVYNRRIFV